jgi:hypothetical protein
MLVGFAASSRTLRHALLFIYKLVVHKLKNPNLNKKLFIVIVTFLVGFLLFSMFSLWISSFFLFENPTDLKDLELKEQIETLVNEPITKVELWKHPEFFKFENYEEFQLTDTINIDLNGNGIFEQIYFESNNCPRILITEKEQELISIGCGKEDFDGFPNTVDWVDLWCVVSDKEVWEVLFKENGDIDKDNKLYLERPSIYIGKEEAGGGIITYRNGNLYWIHQSN